jgi:transcriptional regulator with XRE-family HTH domain
LNQLSDIFKTGLDKTKYSQAEAARLSGIERKTFNTYVNGTREPDFETLIKIASTLKVEKEICSLIMEQFVPPDKIENMGTNINGSAEGLESKYMALLEKTISDKDKNIEEKEADLKALRAAISKITDTDKRVTNLEITVGVLEDKWKGYEPIILGLREFVTGEIASLKRKSHEEVAAALNIKVAEQKKKVEHSRIQKH